MLSTTRKQLDRYYKQYSNKEVVFSSNVVNALGLAMDKSYLKIATEIKPCVICSASMLGAKVIVDFDILFSQRVKEQSNLVVFHFIISSFNSSKPLSFFLPSRIDGTAPYRGNTTKNYHLVSITYTKTAPSDLIEGLGRLTDASENAKRWKDLRVTIFPRIMKEIDLDSSDAIVEIDSQPTKCIIRDLSFNGAKIIVGVDTRAAKDKRIALYVPFGNQKALTKLTGEVLRIEDSVNHGDFVGISIQFDQDTIPLAYTVNLNEYLLANNANTD